MSNLSHSFIERSYGQKPPYWSSMAIGHNHSRQMSSLFSVPWQELIFLIYDYLCVQVAEVDDCFLHTSQQERCPLSRTGTSNQRLPSSHRTLRGSDPYSPPQPQRDRWGGGSSDPLLPTSAQLWKGFLVEFLVPDMAKHKMWLVNYCVR